MSLYIRRDDNESKMLLDTLATEWKDLIALGQDPNQNLMINSSGDIEIVVDQSTIDCVTKPVLPPLS